jgi:hypothetical protein
MEMRITFPEGEQLDADFALRKHVPVLVVFVCTLVRILCFPSIQKYNNA